ncbi:hypothetical protein ACFQZZ_00450 [Nocardia sp. GCM10030253]
MTNDKLVAQNTVDDVDRHSNSEWLGVGNFLGRDDLSCDAGASP